MIHWELCKKLKFGHATKCYKHKTESFRKNDKKNLWLLRYKPLIMASDKCQLKKEDLPVDWVKINENEKREKYFDLVRELKKLWKMKNNSYSSCDWLIWNDPQKIGQELDALIILGRAETIQTTAFFLGRSEY